MDTEPKVLAELSNEPADPAVITVDDDKPLSGKSSTPSVAKENVSTPDRQQQSQKEKPRRSKQCSVLDMIKSSANLKRKSTLASPSEQSAEKSPSEDRSAKKPKLEEKKSEETVETSQEDEKPEVMDVVEAKDEADSGDSSNSSDRTAEESGSTEAEEKVQDSEVKNGENGEDSEEKKTGGGKSSKKIAKTPSTSEKKRRSRKADPSTEKKKEERRLEKERREKERELAKRHKEAEKLRKEEERKQKEEEKRWKEEERKKLLEEKEKKRKEKEEQKEREKKEKEEQEEKKRLEKEAKQKAKEEDLKRKEEAKKQLEESKLKEEEAKREKREKQAQAFAKYFVKTDSPAGGASKASQSSAADDAAGGTGGVESLFKPFAVKDNMRVAPVKRAQVSARETRVLDDALEQQNATKDKLYLAELRKGLRHPGKAVATFPFVRNEGEEDDVQIIEEDGDADDKIIMGARVGAKSPDSIQIPRRAKLLQFDENRRPPYWGTWRKSSAVIRPTKPFEKDSKFFDYDVDSDDEWEDEDENAESLKGDSDEEKESEDEYEIDNEFFVPHGYLSDGEGDSDDEAEGDDDAHSADPEAQQKKLKMKMAEFEEEIKRKTTRLQPVLIGPLWHGSDGDDDANIKRHPYFSRWVAHLEPMEALLCGGNPSFVFTSHHLPPSMTAGAGGAKSEGGKDEAEGGQAGGDGEDGDGQASAGKKKRGIKRMDIPKEAVERLAKFVHLRPGSKNLAAEFADLWVREAALKQLPITTIPKIHILAKIKEIATYDHKRGCYVLKTETMEEYPGLASGLESGGDGDQVAVVDKDESSPPSAKLITPKTSSGGRKRGRPSKRPEGGSAKDRGRSNGKKETDSVPSSAPSESSPTLKPGEPTADGSTPKRTEENKPPPRKSGPMDMFVGKATSSSSNKQGEVEPVAGPSKVADVEAKDGGGVTPKRAEKPTTRKSGPMDFFLGKSGKSSLKKLNSGVEKKKEKGEENGNVNKGEGMDCSADDVITLD